MAQESVDFRARRHGSPHPRAGVFPRVFLAFFSFSVCASSGYLINDLLDLKADRRHPSKRNRPFASGALTPRFGAILSALLFLTAAGFGNLVSPRFVLFLCGYLALTAAYSLALKQVLVADIFLLAFFYTFRILLGGEAAGVRVSFWLAAFSTFFFFSLAAMKRFVELRLLVEQGALERRDYRAPDLPMLGMWGAASGCAAVVVLALYINSEDVTRLYRHPAFLWPVCLAVLFWLCRAWMLANRDELALRPGHLRREGLAQLRHRRLRGGGILPGPVKDKGAVSLQLRPHPSSPCRGQRNSRHTPPARRGIRSRRRSIVFIHAGGCFTNGGIRKRYSLERRRQPSRRGRFRRTRRGGNCVPRSRRPASKTYTGSGGWVPAPASGSRRRRVAPGPAPRARRKADGAGRRWTAPAAAVPEEAPASSAAATV